MATILRSDSLTEEFRVFLSDIDTDNDEDRLRQLWLGFVTKARELREAVDAVEDVPNGKKLVIIKLKNMEDEFFNAKDSRKRVALSNPALWTACHNLCLKAKPSSDLGPLWKAHDEVIRKLDDIHQPFLLRRHEERSDKFSTFLKEANQCLLSVL